MVSNVLVFWAFCEEVHLSLSLSHTLSVSLSLSHTHARAHTDDLMTWCQWLRSAAREDGGPEQANQTRCSQEKGTFMYFHIFFYSLCDQTQLTIVTESRPSVCVSSVMLTFHVYRPLRGPRIRLPALLDGRGCQESPRTELRQSLNSSSFGFVSLFAFITI